MRAENDTTAPTIADAFVEPQIAAARAAASARDPGALSDELTHLVDWMSRAGDVCADLRYAAWLRIMPIFADLDLAIREERPGQVEGLALALARVDYYRQIDLGAEGRVELLDRVRRLLSPKSYLASSPEAGVFTHALLQLADVLRRRSATDEAAARLDQAEAALAQGSRPRARLTLLLQLLRIARELAIPDKPRIRRCAAEAISLSLARELKDDKNEVAARELLAFAG